MTPRVKLMNTPRIIHSSSAEGIPPPTFLIERKLPWVYTAVSDKDLSHATARLLVALSERFNGQYYDATGELFAWPSREYLMARAGIRSKDTFDRSVKQAEARGYL